MTRVLVLTAPIGAGHDLPARRLGEALEARGVAAPIADGLRAMGPVIDGVVQGGSGFDTRAGNVAFDALYWSFTYASPVRKLGGWLLQAVGGPGLLALVEEHRPAVVVSTYPGVTESLGRLRRRGRLAVPVVSVVTDLAALRYWAHPGVDLHLVTHPESLPEVRAVAGPRTAAVAVRGFNDRRASTTRPPGRRPAPRSAFRRTVAWGWCPAAAGAWGTSRAPSPPPSRRAPRPSWCCAGPTPRCSAACGPATRATRGCARSGSPTGCRSSWRPPTCSCTRPPD